MDAPPLPITYEESRRRSVWLLVGSLVLGGGSLMMVLDGAPIMWAGVVLFGLGIPLSVLGIIRPQRLVLDADGVTATSPGRRLQVPWHLVERFEAVEVLGGRMIGFHWTAEAPEQRPDLTRGETARDVARGIAGVDGSFPSTDTYGQDPDELVAVLESARLRYGRPPA
ncbi:hypothetical protein FTX61_13465 [Nitriliruptoraceae bacterium ZYF776]|nr:hypothetical protein [Profundirhabdus halotolerans]